MDLLNSYFSKLIFTQLEEKEGYMIYGAGIASGLAGGRRRYILLFVPNYLAVNKKSRIKDLKWQSLQSRELVDSSYNLKQQSWNIDRNANDILLEVRDRKKEESSYGADGFPFEILLLHNPKKKTIYQYRDKLTLTAAVEMFNSVFNYTENVVHNPYATMYSEPSNIPSVSNWFHVDSGSPRDQDDSFELLH